MISHEASPVSKHASIEAVKLEDSPGSTKSDLTCYSRDELDAILQDAEVIVQEPEPSQRRPPGSSLPATPLIEPQDKISGVSTARP